MSIENYNRDYVKKEAKQGWRRSVPSDVCNRRKSSVVADPDLATVHKHMARLSYG